MNENYFRQLEAENKALREALAKPFEMDTNPRIIVNVLPERLEAMKAVIEAARPFSIPPSEFIADEDGRVIISLDLEVVEELHKRFSELDKVK